MPCTPLGATVDRIGAVLPPHKGGIGAKLELVFGIIATAKV